MQMSSSCKSGFPFLVTDRECRYAGVIAVAQHKTPELGHTLPILYLATEYIS